MTNQAFHDAILKEGPIPVEMVRAILTNQKLDRDHQASWKFYDLRNSRAFFSKPGTPGDGSSYVVRK